MDTYIEHFYNDDEDNKRKRERYLELYESVNRCVGCGGDRDCPDFNITCYDRR